MASFLDTHGIANGLNQVIAKADKHILLVTPYISFPAILFERLLDADERGVETTIVFGKTRLKNRELENMVQLENLSLFYLENLHAKCYSNEKLMVISSMNLYDYSEKNNREMGIQLTQQEDSDLIKDALRECESIMKAAEPIIERKPKYKGNKNYAPSSKAPKKSPQGHCIRCSTPIALDPSAPYCKECYSSWVNYKNMDYREKHCHSCGDKHRTTMRTPLCSQC
jgi:phosphatidylserine/phosphatidylglycerophosphate/cardiolipin synthase-like enzyme